MDAKQAAALIRTMFAAYPERRLSDEDGYVDLAIGMLEPFTVDVGRAAIKAIVRDHSHFPAIADIVKACREAAKGGPERSLKGKAWYVERCIHAESLSVTDADYAAMVDAGLVTLDQAQAHGYSVRRATVLPQGVERPPLRLVHATARRVDDGNAA